MQPQECLFIYTEMKPKRKYKMCAKRWHVNKLGGKDQTELHSTCCQFDVYCRFLFDFMFATFEFM